LDLVSSASLCCDSIIGFSQNVKINKQTPRERKKKETAISRIFLVISDILKILATNKLLVTCKMS
jgi:hypothetical protein